MNQVAQAQAPQTESGVKVKVQKFGTFLSGMVMPNIGAFIAWGLMAALFIPTGWTPNEDLNFLTGHLLTYLLPLLIGYTGGKMVYDTRGGVVGAISTVGVIAGAEIPMFLGAMIMGPLGGWVIKQFDQLISGKVKAGFEMLVNNFSSGILGGILTIIAYKGIGPLVEALNKVMAAGVDAIISAKLLPLANIFIEPAKVLFLNNAINHGILGPLGIEQAAEAGKSVLFLLEPNPGPGLGVLLAFMLFGKGAAKRTAPGAAIIQFLGGIHEIYFPYILMKPSLILAVMAGGVTGTLTFTIFNAGLIATPSPGSIFAVLAMTPKGSHFGVLLGVLLATVVSFLVAGFILKRDKSMVEDVEGDLTAATAKMEEMKGKKSSVASALTTDSEPVAIDAASVKKLSLPVMPEGSVKGISLG